MNGKRQRKVTRVCSAVIRSSQENMLSHLTFMQMSRHVDCTIRLSGEKNVELNGLRGSQVIGLVASAFDWTQRLPLENLNFPLNYNSAF